VLEDNSLFLIREVCYRAHRIFGGLVFVLWGWGTQRVLPYLPGWWAGHFAE
jgi:hypothetical protein